MGRKDKLRIVISTVCIVLFIIGYWIFYTGCCLPCVPIYNSENGSKSSDQNKEQQIDIEKPGEHQSTEGGGGINVNPEDIEGDESQQGNPGGGGGGGGGSGGGGC